MPSRSSASSSTSPAAPSKLDVAACWAARQPRRRCAARAGTLAAMPSQSRSRSAARALGARGELARARARTATPRPTMPGTFSVPPRRPRSCGPPRSNGVERAARRARPGSRRPSARRACAPRARAGRRRARRRRPAACRPPGSRPTWSGTPRARRAARSARIGCTTPVSLFAHTGSTRAPSRARARRRRRRDRAARRVDTGTRVTRTPCGLEGRERLLHRRMLDARRHDVRPPARAPPQRRRASAEVVRLGRAAREDDLARRRARRSAATCSRAARRPRAPPRPPRGRSRDCRAARAARAASPRRPRRARGGRVVIEIDAHGRFIAVEPP